jgi:hypothetical protein
MKTRKSKDVEPKAKSASGPFGEPRTIPCGWDVSAFKGPVQEPATNPLTSALVLSEALLLVKKLNDDSEVSI